MPCSPLSQTGQHSRGQSCRALLALPRGILSMPRLKRVTYVRTCSLELPFYRCLDVTLWLARLSQCDSHDQASVTDALVLIYVESLPTTLVPSIRTSSGSASLTTTALLRTHTAKTFWLVVGSLFLRGSRKVVRVGDPSPSRSSTRHAR